jgi:phage-related protein
MRDEDEKALANGVQMLRSLRDLLRLDDEVEAKVYDKLDLLEMGLKHARKESHKLERILDTLKTRNMRKKAQENMRKVYTKKQDRLLKVLHEVEDSCRANLSPTVRVYPTGFRPAGRASRSVSTTPLPRKSDKATTAAPSPQTTPPPQTTPAPQTTPSPETPKKDQCKRKCKSSYDCATENGKWIKDCPRAGVCSNGYCKPHYRDCKRDSDCSAATGNSAKCGPKGFCVGK